MIPAWLEALILGIVQGLTEFIPISSSGHLALIPYLAGWESHSLAFDVMLHVGTLGAVLVYFRGELLAIVRGLLGLDTSAQGRTYRRIGLYLVPASVPIAVVGLTLADRVAAVFDQPLVVSLLLLVTAGLLVGLEARRSRRVARAAALQPTAPAGAGAGSATAERAWSGDWRGVTGGAAGGSAGSSAGRADVAAPASGVARAEGWTLPTGEDAEDPLGTSLAQVTLGQAMAIGVLQCLAVLPGVSRSGTTIAAGVFAGLTREAATRFSFLLVIPALVGATLLSLPDLADGGEPLFEMGIGVIAAFVSGYVAIRFLVQLVSRERLTGFAIYCVCAAAIGLIGYAMIGPVSAA